MRRQSDFPTGWDEARVQRVLEHYENQTDEGPVAEDEASLEDPLKPSWRFQSTLSPPSVS